MLYEYQNQDLRQRQYNKILVDTTKSPLLIHNCSTSLVLLIKLN